MTIKQLCDHLQIKPSLARSLLAAGLIPGQKRNRVWHIEESDLPRIEQAFQMLGQAPASSVQQPTPKDRCPNCQQPHFGPSEGAGWGEFFECPQCRFSIHEHNLSSPGLVNKAVQDHRKATHR